ncbi:site-2 protease family protein [Halobaculum sp. CBA1158]|uniref:site-2 protease family protein n=1 Tax=Halobaculum sp. CBA1158 TaxID=2904243 RepID=UPI001F162CD4|nr:site-2 protease family protein [Halobaculum sp. CBA1158]UIO99631.1 site-2 protease family protein [Halobaculum sp. CBA1158]
MNTLLWVLVGALAYSFAMMTLASRGYLPNGVRVQGPLTTIHTGRGRAFLNWLSTPRRFWRAWSNVGVGIAVVVMVGMFGFLVFSALATLQNPVQTQANQPSNFLIIPGVNDFLPLAVAPEIVLGLLIALVVHEGGHGLLCRVEDIDIDSMGVVLLTLIPVGAFVEPDEESQANADRGARSRMFAAGVTNNFAVTAIAFALLFGPVVASIAPAAGLAVGGAYSGAPAAEAGIEGGDRITAVDGASVADADAFDAAIANATDPSIEVTLAGGETVTVDREVTAVGATDGNPLGVSIDPEGDAVRVTAVNGTEVRTVAQFREVAREHQLARVETSDGETVAPLGAYVSNVSANGALANQTDLSGSLTITEIDGERILEYDDLDRTLSGDAYDAGDTVTLRVYADGEFREVDVRLGGTDEDPLIGVAVARGVSGVVVDDLGVQRYPAESYLALLGGSGAPPPGLGGITGSALGLVYAALLLPLASIVTPALPYNFAGFYGDFAGFYEVTGPLAVLGEGPVFLLANVLFWTGWINIQLGIFNCIPGYPLDGGRILRMGAEGVVSRLPVANRDRLVTTLTTSIGLTMLAALLVVMFASQVL